MYRCLQLARLGQGSVAPNPMVGSVLVGDNRIIGEGYHQRYGLEHAEVNCIRSVKAEDRSLISRSVLYVSLEPCAHFGKTPPCADLIIRNQIPKVVIGVRDPFVRVDGKGIEKLRAAGIEVEMNVLEKECRELNRRFFRFHTHRRPYIILKWAETMDHKIAGETNERLLISNQHSNRLVHKWRSEEMAILVGSNTALADDPELTTRLWPGASPIRLVVDGDLRLPATVKLFTSGPPTIVFNRYKHSLDFEQKFPPGETGPHYYQISEDASLVHQILNALYHLQIQSVLVEGGARLLQSFIDEGLWDEARVITNEELYSGGGLPAPQLQDAALAGAETLFSDVIRTYQNTRNHS